MVNQIELGVFLIVGLSAICRAGVIQDQDVLDILKDASKECIECSPVEATEIDKNENMLEDQVKDSLDELESEEKVQQRRKRSKSDSDDSSKSSKSKDSSDSKTESDESSDTDETREKKEEKERREKDKDSNNNLPYIARIGRSVE